MDTPAQQIAILEWINYEAIAAIAQITPGLDLTLRDDVILTSSAAFPTPDTTHACLLRATDQTIETLIVEIVDYFRTKNLPATVFVSPACTPVDLPVWLEQYGFIKNEGVETWLALDLSSLRIPAPAPGITVKQVTPADTLTFARTFMAAFDMPVDFAEVMAQLMAPSLELPQVYHYLAWDQEQPVGTCSLFCHRGFGILGSAGVITAYRGSRTAANLALQAGRTAQEQGVNTLFLQTTAGPRFERFLRISGFRPAFTRTSYSLP